MWRSWRWTRSVRCSLAAGLGFLMDHVEPLKRQLDAIDQTGSIGRLEWHFSSEESAKIVQQYFKRKGIDIDVYYTP